MKKLYGTFAAKMIAVILLCLLVLVFTASAISAIFLYEWQGYTLGYQDFLYRTVGADAESYIGEIGWSILCGTAPEDASSYEGLQVRILDSDGKELYSDYDGAETLLEINRQFSPDYALVPRTSEEISYEDGDITVVPSATIAPSTPVPSGSGSNPPAPENSEEPLWVATILQSGEEERFSTEEEAREWIRQHEITVKGYVLADQSGQGVFQTRISLANFLYSWRFAFLWIAGLSFLLGVLVFIFLLCAAGHRKGTDEISPSFVEKIPFDLFTLGIGIACMVCMTPLAAGWDFLVTLIPVILAVGLLLLLWCMSFAVRVKLGNLWSGCMLVRFFRWCWQGAGAIFRNLPILWKWALGLAVFALLDLGRRHSAIFSYNRTTFWWFLCWALIGGATLYAVLAFRRLRKGAKEIASGNMSYSIDEKNLLLDFKDHAHDLNHIRDGLNEAVEQRMKSERFRTELITNVSHDIKTPLTSIVNYVDLLQKEEPKTEKQQEYLEVLSRQSAKLKKLIEDLIEASKASTGNLSVNLQPCDLSVLLDQTAGEYGEKLEKAGLELVLQKPESPVTVMADGRHLWRVFDNLLNNIVKYAMPGTRVYLSLQAQSAEARVTFRNISREPLNLSVAELTERFVQGDASRHTDGNGLGLAIAMSLMKLQKGDLDIEVDGDLFKVTLRFPKG